VVAIARATRRGTTSPSQIAIVMHTEPTAEMAHIIHHILEWSKAGPEVSVPTPAEMLDQLKASSPKYENLLNEYCRQLDAPTA